MIIPMLCVTIFVILVVWFLLPRVARLMIHTPTAISIFVCLSMVQLMAVFISMRCTLCGHFLDRKSGSAGMPRPISYAVFCVKKKHAQVIGEVPAWALAADLPALDHVEIVGHLDTLSERLVDAEDGHALL